MGSQLSLSNRLQVEKRDIKRQERVLDREIAMMEFEKLQCEKNIRKQVKLNMISNATIIAKNYSMIQSNITKLYKMKNQLTTLSLQMSMMHNQQQIHEAMRNVATTMKMLNTRMNLQSVKNIIREFEGEKAKHEISTEMLDEFVGMAHTPARLDYERELWSGNWANVRDAAIPAFQALHGGLLKLIARIEYSMVSIEDPINYSFFEVDQNGGSPYKSLRAIAKVLDDDLYLYEYVPQRELWDTLLVPLTSLMARLDEIFARGHAAAVERSVEPNSAIF